MKEFADKPIVLVSLVIFRFKEKTRKQYLPTFYSNGSKLSTKEENHVRVRFKLFVSGEK